ncbi:AAA family ATPase [Spirochaeta isovalerica]|uniref:Replication-associated recombination protein A n=1 Tax=Spirochaeta isovalerica TaxID=150 RepID=A0A841RCD9_9SPIO|nr:putative ATPase [Spirochaeta isovalerica]
MDLFENSTRTDREPLASRMRPRTLDEFAGQEHIVGKGRLLRRSIQADQLSSLIFYGPPGTGKTTLAKVIAGTTKSSFISLNAVLCGVKDIREAIEEAKNNFELYDRKTILFVDEVHRWNKAQQDALLPWVENGTFILIGATTENPYFEVNSALVSRSRIFQLKELHDEDLMAVAANALENRARGYGKWKVTFEEGALEHLVKIAAGDARTLLNALQLAVETTPESFPPPEGEEIHINLQTAEESIQQKVVLYDKEGDYHFDTISAFIKSIRGSDPDAALYWMAKMLRAGEDPKFILRRMIISASEDIGLADPHAISVVTSAAAAYDRIGMPEGAFPLTEAAIYLATAPKSNSAMAYFDALRSVVEEENREVPNHLRDPSRDKHSFGHGEGYNYPHAYRDHWVAQAYLPEELKGRYFYQPSSMGYEATIQQEVVRRREAQMAVMLENTRDEVLTYSPGDKTREKWVKRITSGQSLYLQEIRDRVFERLNILRHERVLIPEEKSGLFLWEAFRKAPEGLVCGLIPDERDFSLTEHYSRTLPENERPVIFADSLAAWNGEEHEETKGFLFDCLAARDLFGTRRNIPELLGSAHKALGKNGRLVIVETHRAGGTKLSSFLPSEFSPDLKEKLAEVERELYSASGYDRKEDFKENLKSLFPESSVEEIQIGENRLILPEQLDRWLDSKTDNSYGAAVLEKLGDDAYSAIKSELKKQLSGKTVSWNRSSLILYGKKA